MGEMPPELLRKLSNDIAQLMTDVGSVDPTVDPLVSSHSGHDVIALATDAHVGSFNAVIDALARQYPHSEARGPSGIEGGIWAILHEIAPLPPPERAGRAGEMLVRLGAKLAAAVETYVVSVPIEGLRFDLGWHAKTPHVPPVLRVGEVVFTPSTPDEILALHPAPNEYDERHVSWVTALATCTVTAGDSPTATARAEVKIGLGINLLRVLFSGYGAPLPPFRELGLMGENHIAFRWLLRHPPPGETGSAQAIYSRMLDRALPLSLQGWHWWVMQGQHTAERGDLLYGDSPLSRRLAHAVSWSGRARFSADVETAALQQFVALEGLIGREGAQGGTITQVIAERVAFLLGRNARRRRTLDKNIRDLYGIRSKLAHGGAGIELWRLAVLEGYVRDSILMVMEWADTLQTWDAILERLEAIKWASADDEPE